MAIAFVQSKTLGSTYLDSVPVPMTSNVTAGSLLVMGVTYSDSVANNVTAVTDNRGNTWIKLTSQVTSDFGTDVWYVVNANAGTTTVTLTLSNYYTTAVVIQEFSGIATTSPLDVWAQAIDDVAYTTSSTVTLGSATTQADELIIGIVGGSQGTATTGGFTVGSGYSNAATVRSTEYSATGMQSRIVTSTSAYSSTMTSSFSTKSIAFILTFKAPGGTPSTTGQIRVWNGTAWVAKPLRRWNGTAWVAKPLRRWNGTAWVETPY